MTGAQWLDAGDGELLIHTGVTGRAAKMGHRLTIAMRRWQTTMSWTGGVPTAAELTVEVDSLEVLHGEGGVTPLSGPEKARVRSNALRSLDADRFPRIHFATDTIEQSGDQYRLTGTLQIRHTTRQQVIDVQITDLGDLWGVSAEAGLRQSEFGVRPYSLLMGGLKVVDEVAVSLSATRAKDT